MTEYDFRNLSGTAGIITRLKVFFEASFLFELKADKMAIIFILLR